MKKVSVVPGSFILTDERFHAENMVICSADVKVLVGKDERTARVYLNERTWQITQVLQVVRNARAKAETCTRPFNYDGHTIRAIRSAVNEVLTENRRKVSTHGQATASV